MEYVITVTVTSIGCPNGEFVFRTSFCNIKETVNVYHLLRDRLPKHYKIYVNKWEKIGTDVTKRIARSAGFDEETGR